jgi:hypothetical protein
VGQDCILICAFLRFCKYNLATLCKVVKEKIKEVVCAVLFHCLSKRRKNYDTTKNIFWGTEGIYARITMVNIGQYFQNH